MLFCFLYGYLSLLPISTNTETRQTSLFTCSLSRCLYTAIIIMPVKHIQHISYLNCLIEWEQHFYMWWSALLVEYHWADLHSILERIYTWITFIDNLYIFNENKLIFTLHTIWICWPSPINIVILGIFSSIEGKVELVLKGKNQDFWNYTVYIWMVS